MTTSFVVDISAYQHDFPVESLVPQGFAGIIVKSSEGTGYVNPFFANHIQRAKATKRLLVAAYHFVHTGSASAQADLVISVVPKDVPVWLDAEAGATMADALAAASAIRSSGWKVAGVYHSTTPPAGYGWWRAAYLSDPSGLASVVYQAQGGDQGSGWLSGVDLWQFCQHGRITGYGANDVDFSAYRGTFSQLARTGWFWMPAVTLKGDSMDLYRFPDGSIYDIGSAGKRGVSQAEIAAYQSKGGTVAAISPQAIADSIPSVAQAPSAADVTSAVLAALPAWVKASTPPTAAVVDVAALAADLSAQVHAGATVDDIKALLSTVHITAG